MPVEASRSTGPWWPRWAGVFLAAAAVAFFAPAARAECGDYVHVNPPTDAVSPLLPHDVRPAAPVPHQPCDGPNCSSRRPDRAPLLPAAPVVSPAEHAVCCSAKLVTPDVVSGLHVPDPFSVRPVNDPFRLERPPRS